ncbi:WD40 repeat domain-containing protein [Nonomuraea africana]|uniref:Esterase-like activity of phytase family protein n=1 Tax=Nonomuraea africana TaxID=46171 RepID=A0ABR9KP11_9ACTN|nr:hypothetical protein [Nonomuraea africana]MBE1563754.1 hypothetical protein [Nonomuraea africana]
MPVSEVSGVAGARGFGDGNDEVAFTIPDPRITESSGLALSPTHDGVYYTHNDSDAGPTFFALGANGRTRATFTLRGAQARDWEAMAASKDPRTGRGVLWFADIGDNFDGAWPDISIYKVMEPTTLRDAALPAVRYRFTYEDGGHNAEGIMVHPKTGRLYVVTKQFAGAIYEAPERLRAGRTNVLRKVGSAPIMATDAAYAPDGSSFVVRTYFSATVYRALDEPLAKVSMPALDQAESIAYTADGKALLTGSEGANSPVHRVPLPATALPSPSSTLADSGPASEAAESGPASEAAPDGESSAAADGEAVAADSPGGISGTDVLLWLAVAAGATGVITVIARKTR